MNDGWRIVLIPYADPDRTEGYETNLFAFFGMAGFLGGTALFFSEAVFGWQAGATIGAMAVPLLLGGLFLMLFGLWWRARFRRRGWPQVTARCLDQEIRQVYFNMGNAGVCSTATSSFVWVQRILCEFEYEGKHYRVTPSVHYRSYDSEQGAQRFLEQRIGPDQTCRLWINLDNPLQAELVGQGVKDWLLH